MSGVIYRKADGWLIDPRSGLFFSVVPVALVEHGEQAPEAALEQEFGNEGDLAITILGKGREIGGVELDLIEHAVAGGCELVARRIAVEVRKAQRRHFDLRQNEIEQDLQARVLQPLRIAAGHADWIVHRLVPLAKRRLILGRQSSWRSACAQAAARLGRASSIGTYGLPSRGIESSPSTGAPS